MNDERAGPGKPWTDDEAARLRVYAAAGRTHREAARELGRTTAAVATRARKLGVSFARPVPLRDNPALAGGVLERIDAGEPVSRVAEVLRVSEKAVAAFLKARGRASAWADRRGRGMVIPDTPSGREWRAKLSASLRGPAGEAAVGRMRRAKRAAELALVDPAARARLNLGSVAEYYGLPADLGVGHVRLVLALCDGPRTRPGVIAAAGLVYRKKAWSPQPFRWLRDLIARGLVVPAGTAAGPERLPKQRTLFMLSPTCLAMLASAPTEAARERP